MSEWRTFDPTSWHDMPAKAGVYVIFYDGVAVYVGQSNNLRGRLSRHAFRCGYGANYHTPWGSIPDTVALIGKYRLSRRFGDWAMWELRLIKRLRPSLNGTFVNPRRNAAA